MTAGRTMLGGRYYKIIREGVDPTRADDAVAYKDGEDLCVTSKVYDAILDLIEQAKPDLPDPHWDEKELAVLGKMLTATGSTDTARLANIISRLMTLYAKFICDEENKTCATSDHRRKLKARVEG